MPQIYRDNHEILSVLLQQAGSQEGANLLIPDLQRPYVWSPRQVIVLVDSLLRGWPFGSLLLWSVSTDQVAHMPSRQFALVIDRVDDTTNRVPSKEEPAQYRMVLDGQQRVQSLLLAFGGDGWGFKLLDREWHQSLHEKRPRGRAGKHWSFGELCLDLEALKGELEVRKRLTAVDFTSGVLAWVVRSPKMRSDNRPGNYEDPLPATDLPKNSGRFVRLSRLWKFAGDAGLREAADFEKAVKEVLQEHLVPASLVQPLQRNLEDLLRILREVRETRVTFLEVNKYDKTMGDEAVYMDAVVSIFTRLNTAGRTLTREEITFAWVKSGWPKATESFKALRKQLKELGVDLSSDDLMAGVAFVWAIAFNGGRVLSQKDLLDAKVIRPMAQQLAENWTQLEKSILATSDLIYQRDLKFGRHYQSLNSLAILWAWGFLTDQWVRGQSMRELASHDWKMRVQAALAHLSDRWLICSQWAGFWGKASGQKVSDCAAQLAALRAESDLLTNAEEAAKHFIATLTAFVQDTEIGAHEYIDRLAADERDQMRQFFTPLWVWHRLDAERWAESALPLRVGKKQPTLDVDHVVAVELWKTLVPSPQPTDADAVELRQAVHDLGNCQLLETAFNISKSKKPLAEWLKDVPEFKNDPLRQTQWARALGLGNVLVDPRKASLQEAAAAIEARTSSMKSELKEFVSGRKVRKDVDTAPLADFRGESANLEETFRALADQWRRETEMHSSMSKKLRHPAYQKIIALGEPAIPLILQEIRDRPGFWFEALKAITRQSPVPSDERADPRRVRERWLSWGKEKRYIE